MTERTRSTRDVDLIKVAYAHDEMEAEFLQAEPPSGPGADRRSRVLAALLIPVALVVVVVCLATDVLG